MGELIKRLGDKNSISRLMLMWGITAVMLILAFGWYKVLYSNTTSDDSLIAGIIGGAFGQGRAQYIIPFIGVAVTYPLAMLSNLTGIFNVFGIFMAISITSVFFAQDHIFYKLRASGACYVILFVMQWLCLMVFTFTTVAFMLLGTGLLWGYALDNRNKNNAVEYIIAILFMVMGISLRSNVIYLVIIFLPMVVENIICKKGRRFILFCILAICLYFVIKNFNLYIYNATETGAEYLKYNKARAFFFDRDVFDYEQYKSIFSQQGWTENIYNAFYNRMMLDKKYFSYEILDSLRNAFGLSERYHLDVVYLIKKFINTVKQFNSLRIYCFAGLCVLIVKIIKCKGILSAIENIAAYSMPLVLFMMLFVRGRFLDRVALPFMIFGLIQLMLCGAIFETSGYGIGWINKACAGIDEFYLRIKKLLPRISDKHKMIVIAVLEILAVLVVGRYVRRYVLINNKAHDPGKDNMTVVDVYRYVNSHKENLYINCAYFKDAFYDLSVPALEIHKEQFADNLLTKRRWDTYSEWYCKTVERYDLTDKDNLLYSLAMDDNVYLYAPKEGEPEIYKAYMKDAYGLDVELKEEKYFDDNNIIYSVSVKE